MRPESPCTSRLQPLDHVDRKPDDTGRVLIRPTGLVSRVLLSRNAVDIAVEGQLALPSQAPGDLGCPRQSTANRPEELLLALEEPTS